MPTTIVNWTGDTSEWDNPERGWQGWYSFKTATPAAVASARLDGIQGGLNCTVLKGVILFVSEAVRPSGHGNFDGVPISTPVLNNLDAAFDQCRIAGVKVIPKFSYTWPNGGDDTDLSLADTQQHVGQLEQLLDDHEDIIMWLDTGLVGRFGEWHNSDTFPTVSATRKVLVDDILTRFNGLLTLRYPADKLNMYADDVVNDDPAQVITALTKFDGSDFSRIGYHQDSFLTGLDGDGTFFSPFGGSRPLDLSPAHDLSGGNPPTPSAQAQWFIDHMTEDTKYAPFKGEMAGTARSDALSDRLVTFDAPTFHLDVLRSDLPSQQASLDRWTATGDLGVINRKLGYRFELTQAEFDNAVVIGGQMNVRVNFKNDGWSRLNNERPVFVTLNDGTFRADMLLTAIDSRDWGPGDSIVIDENVILPGDIPAGTYDISIWMPDKFVSLREPNVSASAAASFSVRFAGTPDPWDVTRGYNILKTNGVVVSAAGPEPTQAVIIQ